MDVARLCAKGDLGQWNAVLEAMPCVRALVADVVAASHEPENANVEGISFDIHPSGSNRDTGTTQAVQRTTPVRSARLERRGIVAGLRADRETRHHKADQITTSRSQECSDARPGTETQTSFTRVVKHASPLSKRQATQRPKWHPTTCTAPGVTCGNGGNGGPVSKRDIGRDSSPNIGSSSLRLALRDAQASPKLPKWFPLLCTARGITCAKSSTSNHGFKNNHADLPADSKAKREAQPKPMAEARPEPQGKNPKWKPSACTVPGMTCGNVSGVGAGSPGGNTGAGGTTSAKRQSGTGERNKKREPATTAHFWSGPGRSVFIDDEGNAVKIEEDSASAT